MGLIKGLRKTIEKPTKKIDKLLGQTKCPNPLCRSTNVVKQGRKWHCKSCGRDF